MKLVVYSSSEFALIYWWLRDRVCENICTKSHFWNFGTTLLKSIWNIRGHMYRYSVSIPWKPHPYLKTLRNTLTSNSYIMTTSKDVHAILWRISLRSSHRHFKFSILCNFFNYSFLAVGCQQARYRHRQAGIETRTPRHRDRQAGIETGTPRHRDRHTQA